MRTTVTIDEDTEILLRDETRRTGLSFKEVLNRAIRQALGPRASRVEVTPVFTTPFPMDMNSTNFNQFGEASDDDDTLRELSS